MPTIAVRIISKPRKYRRCDDCGKALDGETIRLYGMAHHWDKPYNLYLHRSCITDEETLGKIRDAELRASDGGETTSAPDSETSTQVILGSGDDPDTAPHSVSR